MFTSKTMMACGALALIGLGAHAEAPKLASLFGDHMVMHRCACSERRIPARNSSFRWTRRPRLFVPAGTADGGSSFPSFQQADHMKFRSPLKAIQCRR